MPTATHNIKYRYVCELCGHQSGWFTKEIRGDAGAQAEALIDAFEVALPGNVAGKFIANDALRGAINVCKKQVAGGNYCCISPEFSWKTAL